MKIVRSVFIKANPETVFAVITDFEAYSKWNPWIVKAVGECAVGANVVVDAWVGGKLQQYNHKILSVDSPRIFHWCDVGWFTFFADGERKRTLEKCSDGTQYTVELNVTGFFAFLAQWFFGKSLEDGMTRETEALKNWIEQQSKP